MNTRPDVPSGFTSMCRPLSCILKCKSTSPYSLRWTVNDVHTSLSYVMRYILTSSLKLSKFVMHRSSNQASAGSYPFGYNPLMVPTLVILNLPPFPLMLSSFLVFLIPLRNRRLHIILCVVQLSNITSSDRSIFFSSLVFRSCVYQLPSMGLTSDIAK